MAKVTVHLGCPTEACEDGVHYVEVEYEFNYPDRHFTGEWKGSDDCPCVQTDEFTEQVEQEAEQMVATEEVY